MSGQARVVEPCRLGEVAGEFVKRLAPTHARCESVAQAWQGLLPEAMRRHCCIETITSGCVRIVADTASYMYELQLCKAELLAELQRLCPQAGLRRISVALARRA